MLIPKKWNTSASYNGTNLKPVCVHLAGTGDHVSLLKNKLSIS